MGGSIVPDQIINGFKITHNTPSLSEEEREKRKKEILGEIYKILSSKNQHVDIKEKEVYIKHVLDINRSQQERTEDGSNLRASIS
jgi:hypothetical protein